MITKKEMIDRLISNAKDGDCVFALAPRGGYRVFQHFFNRNSHSWRDEVGTYMTTEHLLKNSYVFTHFIPSEVFDMFEIEGLVRTANIEQETMLYHVDTNDDR